MQKLIWKWMIQAYLWAANLLYHPLAWAYDAVAWLVSFGHWSEWRLDVLDYLAPGPILELGFGTGSLLIEMTTRGKNVIGLEPSPQMQRVTGRKLRRVGVVVNRLQARAERIPIAEGVFTNVIATFPSNYIFQEDVLKDIHRVLKPEGRLVVVGLGVRFRSGLKKVLTGWFINPSEDTVVQTALENIQSAGFSSEIVDHAKAAYVLPVLIGERRND